MVDAGRSRKKATFSSSVMQKEGDFFLVGDTEKAVWFSVVAGDFCQQLVGPDPNARGEVALALDERFHAGSKLDRGMAIECRKVMTHVEVGFIHRDLLDLSAESGQQDHDLA